MRSGSGSRGAIGSTPRTTIVSRSTSSSSPALDRSTAGPKNVARNSQRGPSTPTTRVVWVAGLAVRHRRRHHDLELRAVRAVDLGRGPAALRRVRGDLAADVVPDAAAPRRGEGLQLDAGAVRARTSPPGSAGPAGRPRSGACIPGPAADDQRAEVHATLRESPRRRGRPRRRRTARTCGPAVRSSSALVGGLALDRRDLVGVSSTRSRRRRLVQAAAASEHVWSSSLRVRRRWVDR